MAQADQVIQCLAVSELAAKAISVSTSSATVPAVTLANTGNYRTLEVTSSATTNYGTNIEGSAHTTGALVRIYGKNTSPTPGGVLAVTTTADTTACGIKVTHTGSGGAGIGIVGVSGSTAHLLLVPQAAPPSVAVEGMIYADTDHHLYYYNGSGWVSVTD